MTNLSDLFPAGAGKQVSFVADGSISAAGKPVVLTAAGKVAPIGMTGDPEASGQTTPSGTQSVGGEYSGMAYDSHRSRLLIAFTEADWPNTGQCVSAGISGTTATYATAVTFSSNNVEKESVCFDSDNNVSLISYRDQTTSDYLHVVAVTMDVAGDLTIGTAVSAGDAAYTSSITYDITNDVAVVAYRDGGNSNQGTCRVVSVSGTTPSFGAAANFNTGSHAYMDGQNIAHDSDENKFVVCYGDGANSIYGTAVVGSISGTTITYGTPVVFLSDAVYTSCITFDSNSNKMVIAYIDQNDGEAVKAIVGTVSGTGISFGSAVEIAAKGEEFGIAFDSALNKVVLSYVERTTSDKGEFSVGTVSGTSSTWTTPVEFYSYLYSGASMAYDANSGKSLVAYRQSDVGTFYLKANVLTTAGTNLTAADLLGISDAAISDTASGNITVKGGIAVNGLSSLTPGTDYYAQGDGTISTSSSGDAVKLGRALSATSIDLEYQS
jgi:hypothetical protein